VYSKNVDRKERSGEISMREKRISSREWKKWGSRDGE
jgi:hypothetical protein